MESFNARSAALSVASVSVKAVGSIAMLTAISNSSTAGRCDVAVLLLTRQRSDCRRMPRQQLAAA